MARKKKEPSAMESVAASEHATEGETKRTIIDLPGMVGEGVEKPHYPELDAIVFEYVAIRDKLVLQRAEEKANRELILAFMEARNLGSYEVDGNVVVKKTKAASIKVVSAADYTGEDECDD